MGSYVLTASCPRRCIICILILSWLLTSPKRHEEDYADVSIAWHAQSASQDGISEKLQYSQHIHNTPCKTPKKLPRKTYYGHIKF